MNNGRRVELDVTYNNAPFAGQVGAEIESLTYVDNAADDSDSIDTVSYTHLDVYKRQRLCCVALRQGGRGGLQRQRTGRRPDRLH